MADLRRHARSPLGVPVQFAKKGTEVRLSGHARDISIGGVFVETETPLSFRDELVVYLTVAKEKEPLLLPGVVRWTREAGMGVQFDLLGARETHLITEITRPAE